MTDGELSEKFWKYKEQTDTESMETGQITLSLCDLHAIIEEAKKEFPLHPKLWWTHSKEAQETEFQQYFTDVTNWALKWFGDASP